MANIVTLYIDDSSIRLLVTSGKQIKKWGEMPLEPGLVEGAVVIKEAEVAAKIKQLLKEQKVRARTVILGLSGLLCLTRVMSLPDLPREMLAEAVTREAKRVLPLPLEQVYFSWQTLSPQAEKTRVFLVAVRRKTADSLLRTLNQAGLKPSFMDIKPLALARVVGESTAIIVDAQPTELDVVIMVDGIPHPVRTVPFPSREPSWQERLPIIKNELGRTIKFYNDNNQDKPLASDVPLFVSGALVDESELCQSLSQEFGHPVSPLSSPLESPEVLDSSPYMANIGLALTELALENKAGLSAVKLNALPTAKQPKPRSSSKPRLVVVPIAIVIGFLLVPLVMRVQDTSAAIVSARSQLGTTNQIVKQRLVQQQGLTESITELEEKLAEVEETRDTFNNALSSLNRQDSSVNGDLRAATNLLPGTVELTDVSHASGVLVVSGKSPNEAEILVYATRLDASGRFSEVTIASISEVEGGAMDFTLVLRERG